MKYKNNRNVVYSCKYHIVFCPKYRRKILIGEVEEELKRIVKEVSKELKVELLEVETDQDHIHLLVDCDPQFGISKFIKILKGRSSKLLRGKFRYLRTSLPTLWTNSYFVSTVGGAPISIVKQYIENQQTSQSIKEKVKWENFLNDYH
jgi:putative transposase